MAPRLTFSVIISTKGTVRRLRAVYRLSFRRPMSSCKTKIRNVLLVVLTTLMLMIVWAVATTPRLVMIFDKCNERFSELRNAPDRQIVGPPSSRVLKSGFSSVLYPIGQSTEFALIEALQANDIPVEETHKFMLFDNGRHITVQIIDAGGMQTATYDFDHCGRIF